MDRVTVMPNFGTARTLDDLKRILTQVWSEMANLVNNCFTLYVQSTQPTIPNNTTSLWQDTTNTPNEYYLVSNFGGTHKLIQLTAALPINPLHKHSKLWASDGTPEAITVDANGNVGLGCTPIDNLHVSGGQIVIDNFGDEAGVIGRRATGSVGSESAVAADEIITSIGGRGYGATGYADSNRGKISVCAAENWTDSAQGAYIIFLTTATGGTTRSEKMRLTGTGDLLISTGYVQLTEMTAPSAPSANQVAIYAEDDGAGKTRLMAKFSSGAAQQIAIQP